MKRIEKAGDLFIRYIKCLTIKDLFVYSDDELINRFIGYQIQVGLIKQKTISQVTKSLLAMKLSKNYSYAIAIIRI